MPRTYADLLREARSQIREVTPQEVDALPEGGAAVIDVREDSEWEQGHLPGAIHISKSYVEQQIEAAAPDRDAPGVLPPAYAPGAGTYWHFIFRVDPARRDRFARALSAEGIPAVPPLRIRSSPTHKAKTNVPAATAGWPPPPG